MLNERRRTVLSALVDEYIASVQPVGSKVLVERYHLGCSPATVRSELAALEETGLVFQPHVSAGRIPTDSGYRAYVDDVVGAGTQQLSTPEAEGVRRYYAELEHELTDVLRETSAMLSKLTSYVAVVAAPTLRRARIRRVTLVPLATRRALVVVVTDSGQVANRTIEFEGDVPAGALASVEAYLSRTLDGAMGGEAETVRSTVDGVPGHEAHIALRVLDVVLECLAEADEEHARRAGRLGLDGRRDVLLNPTLIVEVLSYSTEAYDRGTKFALYRQIPSLQEYLLVSQGRVQVELYTRGPNDTWTLRDYRAPTEAVALASVGCTLALSEVYDKVDFEPA